MSKVGVSEECDGYIEGNSVLMARLQVVERRRGFFRSRRYLCYKWLRSDCGHAHFRSGPKTPIAVHFGLLEVLSYLHQDAKTHRFRLARNVTLVFTFCSVRQSSTCLQSMLLTLHGKTWVRPGASGE